MYVKSVFVALSFVVTSLVSSSTIAEPPQAPELQECEEILEEIYGQPFDGCLPNATNHCNEVGGVPLVCAYAEFNLKWVGDRPSMYSDCPNGVGEPTPAGQVTIRCWLLTDSGEGSLALGPGTVETNNFVLPARACLIPGGFNRDCENPEVSRYFESSTALVRLCGAAETVTSGLSGTKSYETSLVCDGP